MAPTNKQIYLFICYEKHTHSLLFAALHTHFKLIYEWNTQIFYYVDYVMWQRNNIHRPNARRRKSESSQQHLQCVFEFLQIHTKRFCCSSDFHH